MQTLKKIKRKHLLIIIIALYGFSAFLMFSPYIQKIKHTATTALDQTQGYKYSGEYVADKIETLRIDQTQLKPIPKENTLVIPKISVDGKIHEGQNESTLNKGIWRRPQTSTPGSASNIVFAAHRYQDITAPNSFYNLDKLEINDEILVYWEGKEHVYQINDKKVVPATAIEIENPTPKEQLTLYTCEPLYSAENRLVITATPKAATDDTK